MFGSVSSDPTLSVTRICCSHHADRSRCHLFLNVSRGARVELCLVDFLHGVPDDCCFVFFHQLLLSLRHHPSLVESPREVPNDRCISDRLQMPLQPTASFGSLSWTPDGKASAQIDFQLVGFLRNDPNGFGIVVGHLWLLRLRHQPSLVGLRQGVPFNFRVAIDR